ncbi:MAG: hypothetical protein VKL59_15990 [Nostocaceae cyanobacterium]|nr:hypothetical protein [Nostocaceae cyanobacterium]
MRTSTTPPHNSSPGTPNNYSASVPLSVYRQLAAELQAAEAMINSLSLQNKHLAQENHELRQEIEKAVQAVLRLKRVVDSYAAGNYNQPPHTSVDTKADPNRPPANLPRTKQRPPRQPYPVPPELQRIHQRSSPQERPPSPPPADKAQDYPPPEKYFTEQEERRYRYPTPKDVSAEVNGWWLALAIFFIVITAFGVGYLAVRPLLQNQNQNQNRS